MGMCACTFCFPGSACFTSTVSGVIGILGGRGILRNKKLQSCSLLSLILGFLTYIALTLKCSDKSGEDWAFWYSYEKGGGCWSEGATSYTGFLQGGISGFLLGTGISLFVISTCLLKFTNPPPKSFVVAVHPIDMSKIHKDANKKADSVPLVEKSNDLSI